MAAALVDLAGRDGSPGSAAAAGAALAAKGLRVVWPGDFGCAAVERERPQVGRGAHAASRRLLANLRHHCRGQPR